MVERLRVRRDSGHSPLFQAMINVHVARAGTGAKLLLFDNCAMPFGDSLLENYLIPQQEGQYDLALELLDTGDEIVGGLRYDTDAFDDCTAVHLGQQFLSVLEQAAENPIRCIGEFRIDPPGDEAATTEQSRRFKRITLPNAPEGREYIQLFGILGRSKAWLRNGPVLLG